MSAGWLAWFIAYGAFALLWPGRSGPGNPQPGYAWFLLLVLSPWSAWLVLRCARRGRGELLAVLLAGCAQLLLIYVAHIVATRAGAWIYAEDLDRLLGPRYGGVPVEEFFFYPMMINLALLNYLVVRDRLAAAGVRDVAVSRARLRRWLGGGALACFAAAVWLWAGREPDHVVPPQFHRDAAGVASYAAGALTRAWAVLCLSSAGVNLLYLWWAERHTPLMLRAAVLTLPVFVAQSFLVDLLGASRGWWVFNAQACSGWWIGPLPVEEVPMFTTGVLLPVSLYESMRRLLGPGTRGS